ncbi:MAG TPA: hypothetical protein PLJ78_04755 [Anaerolineae bacterium]|nr:hypothetical protein [Anaerolineae bacterium]HQK13242.1 hypothetical protein [Anaerolineae bacterium]
MLNKRSVHILFAILLVLGLAAAVIQAAPANQLALTSPLPGPGPFDSPLPPPLLCPTTTNRATFTIEVSIEGLEGEYPAELQLLADTSQTTACLSLHRTELPHLDARNGSHSITVTEIPDGFYKLTIDASTAYFRDPAGYLFQVKDGQIVRRPGFVFRFRLVPPAEQNLPPCPQFHICSNSPNLAPDVTRIICKAEPLIDLSAPSKSVPSNPLELRRNKLQAASADYIYRYVGVGADQDNQGVWGRRYVVDPSVDHSLWPWQKQFVVEYSYARGPAPDRHWMETGWAEVSWRDDQQYVYQYDSSTREWHFFDQFALEPGSPVETLVEYRPDENTWWALLYLHDDQWALLAEENLDFILADNGYNCGEIYLSDSNMPSPILPLSKFDKGYLKIDEVWRIWDTRYATFISEDPPYQCDVIEQYTYFNIHSPIIFLPFVLKNW